jgi:UPF0755 protein
MKRKSTTTACFVFFLAVLCLTLILTFWWVSRLESNAKQAFGVPSPNLEYQERIYLSARLLLQQDDLQESRDTLEEPVLFSIQMGETTKAITDRLEGSGIITNAAGLRDYLRYSGLDRTLQAGEYLLSPRMSPVEIAHALQDASPSEVTFYILPGWRLEEIAAALPTSGLGFSPEAFLATASHPPPRLTIVGELSPEASLEGFLFPDGYRLPRETTLETFLSTILQNFHIKVSNEIRQGYERQGLNLYQAISLASIVERESIVADEMPFIASVFLNRLRVDMRLDSDPTVQYALGFNSAQSTWWTNPLSLADLQIDSPYNTYLYGGLPPGPIANPSLNALQAVAYPAQTPYYYFRAACDGSGRHSFAKTFEEHQQNACE